MIIEFSTKQPTLLVAETEEAGALHQVLRSQTSRCVVLDLAVCVVHCALIAFADDDFCFLDCNSNLMFI